MASRDIEYYFCPRCQKNFIRSDHTVLRCLIQHQPGDCCHYGDKEAPFECPKCSACMKPNYGFQECTQCGYSTEKLFDESFMEGVAKGVDIMTGQEYTS